MIKKILKKSFSFLAQFNSMPGAADVAFKHSTTVDGFNCASISEELVISTFTISLKFV